MKKYLLSLGASWVTPPCSSREATDGPVLGSEEIRNEMEEIFKRHRVAFDERYVWNRNANGSDALAGRVAWRHFTQG